MRDSPQSSKNSADGASSCSTVESELDEIWYYVAQESRSVDTADRLIDLITERFLLLAQYPYVGRSREHDLRTGLRSFPAGQYIVFYRIEGDDVLILHVVHGGRDLEAFLSLE